MRVQLHFELHEDDGRRWFKRYFVEDFPTLPDLYNYIEGASILQSIETDPNVLTNLDSRVYYVSQIVWLKDESGIYPLIVCTERQDVEEAQ